MPQTLPAAFQERLELDAKVALLRRAAGGELAAEKDLVAAFEVRMRKSTMSTRATWPSTSPLRTTL